MKELFRNLKLSLYSKKGYKIWGYSIFFILLILFIIFNNKVNIEVLNKLVSSDMFNISVVLAGFIFTGLGMIITSNSKMITELKETGNLCVIKNYYGGTIFCFILTILLYLFKTIFSTFVSNTFFIKIYLFITIETFILALIFFTISLKILSAIIND